MLIEDSTQTQILSIDANVKVKAISEVGITNGLVAYYPLNKDAKDYSGNGYHGTVTGAVLTGGGFDGNGAYRFDGVDDFISGTTNIGIVGDAEFTISYWAKWNGSAWSTDFPSGVGSNSTGVSNRGLCTTWSSGRIALDFWNSRFRATQALNVNTLYHVSFVKQKGAISNTQLFVNGIGVSGAVEGTNSVPDIIDSVVIVGRTDSTRWFNGEICNVKIFNRALTPEEIAVEYKRTGVSKMTQHNGTVYIQGQVKETI